MSKEHILSNNVKAKIIDNNTICIYGDENSSNYFINIEEIVKIILKDTSIINKDLIMKTFSLNKHDIEIMNLGINLYRNFDKIYHDEENEEYE